MNYIPSALPSATESMITRLRGLLSFSEPRHIAIGGVSYCGSTLLSTILGGLPEVGNVGESHWLIDRREDGKTITADLAQEDYVRQVHCRQCGSACTRLSREFRLALQQDPGHWYEKIRRQLGCRYLVSSDKNLSKLKRLDPQLDLHLIVLFRSPEQALMSHLRNQKRDPKVLPSGDDVQAYLETYAAAYEGLMNCRIKGKKIFLNFDDFRAAPETYLKAVCSVFHLRYDPQACQEISPDQHYLGGNRRVASMLKDSNAVRIDPQETPDFAPALWDALKSHESCWQIYRTLIARQADHLPPSSQPENTSKIVSRSVRQVLDSQAIAAIDHHLLELGALRGFDEAKLAAKRRLYRQMSEDQRQLIERRRESLTKAKTKPEQARFLEHMLSNFDFSAYESIQRDFLTSVLSNSSPMFLKYLNLDYWMKRKFDVALALNLHDGVRRDVLDLGCGACHFGYICRYFGHGVLGTDLDLRSESGSGDADLLERLSDIFNVERRLFRIEARQSLPDFGRRFDLVTGLMVKFDYFRDKSRWQEDDWTFFFQDVARHVLKDDGQLYLRLNLPNPGADLGEMNRLFSFFKGLGAEVDPTLASVFFNSMKNFRASA